MPTEVKHEVLIVGNPPVLKMANDDDDFYVQTFHNWIDVNVFVGELREQARKAFGPIKGESK